MNVKSILAAKRGDVVVIEPATTLADAATILTKHRIGALVVLGAERCVIGIVSERDLVRAIAEHGAGALEFPVSKIMTRDVMTCTEQETVSRVMSRMTGGKFRHLPVLENGQLVGIVSIGDVVKHHVDEIENESEALRDYIRTA
jgi:CBS domain-containing protein